MTDTEEGYWEYRKREDLNPHIYQLNCLVEQRVK